jgi:hypothetical protein
MRALVLALLCTACGHDRGVSTPAANAGQADTRLIVKPSGDAWSLAFELSNPDAAAVTTTFMYPFTSFQLAVTDAGGAPLEVGQPALDLPVQPRALVIPARGAATIPSPIRLRFRADAPPTGGGDDPFLWTIRAAAQPVTLTASFALPGLGARTATAALTP